MRFRLNNLSDELLASGTASKIARQLTMDINPKAGMWELRAVALANSLALALVFARDNKQIPLSFDSLYLKLLNLDEVSTFACTAEEELNLTANELSYFEPLIYVVQSIPGYKHKNDAGQFSADTHQQYSHLTCFVLSSAFSRMFEPEPKQG